MRGRRGYVYCGLTSTLNVVLYALTLGRFLWLEGRVRGGVFRNWLRLFRFRPAHFAQPTTEDEIVALVKGSTGLRVFGAGHSFNAGVVADHTLVSLDRYHGVLWKYREAPLPYTLFEVRFTPGGHQRTLIGPGRGRRSAWLDLLTNDSHGFERYFTAAETLMREVDARPHPGKFNETFGPEDLGRMHGEHFVKFLELARRHDPERKFANDFTRRLFGPL